MSDSPDEIPTFEELAADPEIAALLDFEPVPRKRHVEGGWTPELQREFIARLATHGSPGRACDEMGKNLTGMMKVYRNPMAASFRASWHAAIGLCRSRSEEDTPDGPPPMAKPPSIDHRVKHGRYARLRAGSADEGASAHDNPAPEFDDEESFELKEKLTLELLAKYAKKLQQERTARHAGKIAEADFYLRQATWFEVAIDLTSTGLFAALEQVRRDDHDLLDIADTPASRVLDHVRRQYWATAGEPERPPPPVHLLVDHGSFRTEPLESAGKASRAPSWVDPDEWRALDNNAQFARYKEQYARDAAAYAAWLDQAAAEHAARKSPSSSMGEADFEASPDAVRRNARGGEGRGEGAHDQ